MIPANEKIDLEFVSYRNDPYAVHIGHGVEISTMAMRAAGVYRGMTTNGQLLLKPHINRKINGDSVTHFMKDDSAFVAYNHAVMVTPFEESELIKLIEHSNRKEKEEERKPKSVIANLPSD